MFVILLLMLETSLLIGVVGWVLFDIYKQGCSQKMAALALLESLNNNQINKIDTVNKFLQNRLHLTGDEVKKQQQLFLRQELGLLQSIMQLPSINDKLLLQIYAKLQAVLLLYCTTKPPSEMKEVNSFQAQTTYEDYLSSCQAKLISYLESKDLIVPDIRNKIHAFDKTLEEDKPAENSNKQENNNTEDKATATVMPAADAIK